MSVSTSALLLEESTDSHFSDYQLQKAINANLHVHVCVTTIAPYIFECNVHLTCVLDACCVHIIATVSTHLFFRDISMSGKSWGVETGNGSIVIVWNNNSNATHLNPEEPFSYKVHKSKALNWLLSVVYTVEHHFLITVVNLSMQTATTSSSSV